MATPTSEQLATLKRLWTVANGHSGQCKYIAEFLLGLYNGIRFPVDLTGFRALDQAIFRDCLTVLEMDSQPQQEVHLLLGCLNGEFEKLAEDWRIPDRSV
ncbi:DUF7673 family protein [Aromatoleum buckelii]|uniref:DUF7673 domain-containing protein n=1 Tax=Aromatoleum buckelii TaxID=200254 RepID=A0ABX1N7W3_9RHOO|nr:hypothetical protein [Aromatoleum buckelii]MCK0509691.1 hypothetical protein [Aromatoleum buckelii]